MPYIQNDERDKLDRVVDELHERGAHVIPGFLNYILFALCKRYVSRDYESIRNFLAEIGESEHEIRRRILAPYEDTKIQVNGDI